MAYLLITFNNNVESYLLAESIFKLNGIPLVVTKLVILIPFDDLPLRRL